MTDFPKYIDDNFNFDTEAKTEFMSLLNEKLFKKGEEIITDTKVCENLYFLKKGLVKFYFISSEGKEIIFRFFCENSFFTSLESFLNQKKSSQFAKALEDTEVLYIRKMDLDILASKYSSAANIYKLMFSFANTNMVKRFSELMSCDATVRYHNFVSENAPLMQRISLGDLASYLGITQESLSRIRAAK